MEPLRVGQRAVLRQLLNNTSRTSLNQPIHSHLSTIRPTFRSRPAQTRLLHTAPKRTQPSQFTQSFRTSRSNGNQLRQRRWESSDASLSKPESQLSLGQRLKKMSKDYGWAAVGVYLGLSALDLPFCFLAVKLLGTDTIGHWEHVVVSYVKGILQWPISATQEQLGDAAQKVADTVDKAAAKVDVMEPGSKRLLDDTPASGVDEATVLVDHGYKEAEAANTGDNASLWTQMVLAYAIHKSFIFVRVPLTAAILPKVVKTLRGWGWNIGPKRKAKAVVAGQAAGVNTKGSSVRPEK